ncbi:Dirigent protein 21 [Sesamum alatum]|uniref:Dirigent protein n=1 Tax=Sesamum alatum TaxID=300844 RepID=A0AAE2CJZ0_9LAMI|nr:Dirigent protein 21 [Sesamum alatum]
MAILPISSNGTSLDQNPKSVQNWVQNLNQAKQKVTKLSLLLPPSTGHERRGRGRLELSSELIGYAQGITASASVEELILFEPFTFVFTNKAYNESTLAVLGNNPMLHKYRELPIVGGTGVFRLARGLVSYQTYAYNNTSGDGTIEVDMVVLHY